MTKGTYEVVGRLPPGQGRKTLLAVTGSGQGFKRLAVLRPVGGATQIAVANVHPQLPPPLGVDDLEGTSYAIYDFFPGATLHEIGEVYRSQDQLPPLGLVVRIVIDAARIIHVAHEHVDPLGGVGGFVHGGISDASLLLGFDGEVRVIDFGLRKVNRFTAPEAASGGVPLTAQTDVFSLAAALHAALTGFDKAYAPLLARAPSAREFPPPSTVHPDATQELDALLMRAMLPEPESRLASAAELADDLERIAGAQLPQREACATRLKQLFEERLDGFRNMVPKLSSDAPPASSPPKPRASKPALAAQPAPRKSGPRAPIPTGTQPEANPIGKRPTPPEVKAAFGDPDGLEDERTILADSDPRLAPSAGMKTKVEPTRSERSPAPRGSGPKKPVAPLPDVPWEQGMAPEERGQPTDQRDSRLPPSEEPVPIEEVPTGLSRRVTGAQPALSVGGSTREEKARARGQELVDTGEIEGDEADDLRDQPTVVRVSGQHKKLVVEPPPEMVAAAFGDVDAEAEAEPGTAIITKGDGPKAKAAEPPVLEPEPEPVSQPGSGPLEAPDTGVIGGKPEKKPEPPKPPKPKKKGGAARKLIAFLLLLMAGGLGYGMLKHPALMKAKFAPVKSKIEEAMVKYGLKKPLPPQPPPEEPPPPPPAVAEDPDAGAGAGAELAMLPAPDPDAGLAALLEDEGDGGEEEEEEEDGGVYASDGGRHPDGGVVRKVKKKKKKKRREWWKTQ